MSNLAHKMTDNDVYDHLHMAGKDNVRSVATWEVILLIGLLAVAGLSLLDII